MDKRNRILEAKKVKSVRCLYWLHSFNERLNHINPSGGTEIYFALWTLLDKMQPGQTLMVISDFRASVALSGREYQRIEQKIREKKVKVSHVRRGNRDKKTHPPRPGGGYVV